MGDASSKTLHTLGLGRYQHVTSEHKDLEARIRRAEVLDVDRPTVACAKKNPRRKALTDYQLRGVVWDLIRIGGSDGGGRVLNSHSGCKTTECAKHSTNKKRKKKKNNIREEI